MALPFEKHKIQTQEMDLCITPIIMLMVVNSSTRLSPRSTLSSETNSQTTYCRMNYKQLRMMVRTGPNYRLLQTSKYCCLLVCFKHSIWEYYRWSHGWRKRKCTKRIFVSLCKCLWLQCVIHITESSVFSGWKWLLTLFASLLRSVTGSWVVSSTVRFLLLPTNRWKIRDYISVCKRQCRVLWSVVGKLVGEKKNRSIHYIELFCSCSVETMQSDKIDARGEAEWSQTPEHTYKL